MYSVDVKNVCRCFIKDAMLEHQEFATKAEAKEEAESMLEHMQKNFCKKHEFHLIERYGSYIIDIVPRKR